MIPGQHCCDVVRQQLLTNLLGNQVKEELDQLLERSRERQRMEAERKAMQAKECFG